SRQEYLLGHRTRCFGSEERGGPAFQAARPDRGPAGSLSPRLATQAVSPSISMALSCGRRELHRRQDHGICDWRAIEAYSGNPDYAASVSAHLGRTLSEG